MSTDPWQPYDPASFYAHILFGVVAYGAGIVALFSRKGSALHVRAGWFFAAGMVVPILTSLRFLVDRFLPLILIVAVADLYLIATGLMVFQRHRRGFRRAHSVLVVVPLVLGCAALVRAVGSLAGTRPWVGPVLLCLLFFHFAFEDLQVLRGRGGGQAFWVARHLSRMLFAFAFATTAVLNIHALDVGLPFQATVIGPLVLAILVRFALSSFEPARGRITYDSAKS